MFPTESELAWAAGLFEGEGCITGAYQSTGINERARRYYGWAGMAMTDKDVMERFVDIMHRAGFEKVSLFKETGLKRKAKVANGEWKQAWKWKINGLDNLRRLRELFGPWLGERRKARLDEVIDTKEKEYEVLPRWSMRGRHREPGTGRWISNPN